MGTSSCSRRGADLGPGCRHRHHSKCNAFFEASPMHPLQILSHRFPYKGPGGPQLASILCPRTWGIAASPWGLAAISTCRISPASQGIGNRRSFSCWISSFGCGHGLTLLPLSIGHAEHLIGLGQAVSDQGMHVFGKAHLVMLTLAILGVNCLGLWSMARLVFEEEHSPTLPGIRGIIPDDHRRQGILAIRDPDRGAGDLEI